MNKFGDDQMSTYFRSKDNHTDYGGMICDGDNLFLGNASAGKLFETIKNVHQSSHQECGGEHVTRDDRERTCAIRLPPNRFFEVFLMPFTVNMAYTC